MTRAVEPDREGSAILPSGIRPEPRPKRLQPGDLQPADVLVWYRSSPDRLGASLRELARGP